MTRGARHVDLSGMGGRDSSFRGFSLNIFVIWQVLDTLDFGKGVWKLAWNDRRGGTLRGRQWGGDPVDFTSAGNLGQRRRKFEHVNLSVAIVGEPRVGVSGENGGNRVSRRFGAGVCPGPAHHLQV